jgi:hypothetical protein
MKGMSPARDDPAEVDFLLSAAVWQDSLLQNYRVVHLTSQSIFLAIGAGLSVAVVSTRDKLTSFICCSELLILGLIACFVLLKMRKLVVSRGHDVSYWHSLIIRKEQRLPPPERHFTKFKIHQSIKRAGVEDLSHLFLGETKELTNDQVDLLVGRGLSHTRKVLDVWLFSAMVFMWAILSIICTAYCLRLALSS